MDSKHRWDHEDDNNKDWTLNLKTKIEDTRIDLSSVKQKINEELNSQNFNSQDQIKNYIANSLKYTGLKISDISIEGDKESQWLVSLKLVLDLKYTWIDLSKDEKEILMVVS
ncbi:hypothetical protein [Mesoplasma corruscae]|uniref:Uncharacterized protein n=1 Tax=Mesoplasma corruscae TaxID=216874 RepID=A0A2S5RGK3_9MOLU|nr:hypothetical protein [Mesoplasma corruscae]PPE06427.1 hypothetical protein MCORR_v1c00550 [Mesoplasma corruscae]